MAKRETKAQWAEWVLKVPEAMDREYGTEYRCYLDHETSQQLLIAVIMNTQCTDVGVNIVMKDLFQKYDTLKKFTEADLKELEQDTHSTGFYHSKAKSTIACCKEPVERYNGEVSSTIEELTSLADVKRKTANVIRGDIYGEPSIVVGIRVKRTSGRLGFAKEEDPEKIEYRLMKMIPRNHQVLRNTRIVILGGNICFARSSKCEKCFLRGYCSSAETKETARPKPRKGESSW